MNKIKEEVEPFLERNVHERIKEEVLEEACKVTEFEKEDIHQIWKDYSKVCIDITIQKCNKEKKKQVEELKKRIVNTLDAERFNALNIMYEIFEDVIKK